MSFPASESESPQPEASTARTLGETVIPKKYIFGGLGVILLVVLTFFGLLNRGYESKTIIFSGIARSSTGTGFGPKRLFLRKGQTLVVDYETDAQTGGLYIRLVKLWAPPNSPATGLVRVQSSQNGQLRVPIPDTSVYQLRIHGSPDRDGYHVSYKIQWRAE